MKSPSQSSSFASMRKMQRSQREKIKNSESLKKTLLLILKGCRRAIKPTVASDIKIVEPINSPNASLGLFSQLKAAQVENISEMF